MSDGTYAGDCPTCGQPLYTRGTAPPSCEACPARAAWRLKALTAEGLWRLVYATRAALVDVEAGARALLPALADPALAAARRRVTEYGEFFARWKVDDWAGALRPIVRAAVAEVQTTLHALRTLEALPATLQALDALTPRDVAGQDLATLVRHWTARLPGQPPPLEVPLARLENLRLRVAEHEAAGRPLREPKTIPQGFRLEDPTRPRPTVRSEFDPITYHHHGGRA